MKRRDFIKGSLGAFALMAVPVVAKKEEVAEVDYLGNWGGLYGICRKHGEPDSELRKRILEKLNERKTFSCNGSPFEIEVI